MSAYRLSLSDGEPVPNGLRRPKRSWRRFLLKQLTTLSLFLMIALLAAVVLYPYVVVNVPTGHVGVLWKRFHGGTTLDPRQLRDEGLRFIWPWNKLFIYDLRLQSRTDTYTAISNDGINITAAINIRYRLKHDAIPQLHQSIGPDFITLLVLPEIGNRMREIIADYPAEEVYSTKRHEIQVKIRERAEAMLGEKMMEQQEIEDNGPYSIPLYAMLNLVDTLILGIELPPAIVTAINRKLEQYYLAQEYTFLVEREVKESQRKKIEAEGIHEFQQIVSQGVSDSYLRWRGIEATLQLAQSPNSKVVIIGSGKDGVPIILGNADGSPPRPQTAPGSDAAPKGSAAWPAVPLANTPPAVPPRSDEPPSPAASEVPRSYFPFPISMSEIEALFSRFTGPFSNTQSGTAPSPH